MKSHTITEIEETRLFVQPKEGENVASLLKRCIPQVQTKRARGYTRLEEALKRSLPTQADKASTTRTPPHPPSGPFSPQPDNQDYPTVCANVTEDLKLCSEAVLQLRQFVASPTTERVRQTGAAETQQVLKWLDGLQELEERKLVATVSRHVLVRSELVSNENRAGGAELKEKVGKYVREIGEVHELVNEILDEMREYFLENDKTL